MDADVPIKCAKTGRFLPGHKAHPNAGRPPNAANVLTKSLREQVLEGFGDVPKFVSELKKEFPPAAAGLLARMMPSGDAPVEGNGATITIVINPIPSGFHKIEDADGNTKWFTTAEAAENYRASLPPMIEGEVTRDDPYRQPDEPVVEPLVEVEIDVDTSNVTRLRPIT